MLWWFKLRVRKGPELGVGAGLGLWVRSGLGCGKRLGFEERFGSALS